MDLTPPNVQSLDDVKIYLERMYDYLKWIGNFQCQFMEWQEVESPERPEAGRARMYATESSDGRTQLVAVFDTGDAIRMVIEQQTSDDLEEGSTNLFLTSDRISEQILLDLQNTDNLAEGGSNLYYSDTRVASKIATEIPDTDSLDEGTTNLYYTDARADVRVDAGFTSRQQTHEVNASIAHAITDPANTPATADALRDDLVLNSIPDIEAALNALGAKINAILVKLEGAETFADS